ncbi:formate dehydrogenase subunit alpha [Clostridium cylindrosporum]|uniref:Formate dehydrogenase H n=1 Tax=Clostridium cylindrosporum DSM 605 TaxID=1121307 RepID=A0A0J8D7V4_CLOCY|nr:formate dehydrogenase subunit alpha [Clostridium cylindrosporum]KMT22125.1 formate dehydrogenase H [Clostridium cylindrosporum DSM 605]
MEEKILTTCPYCGTGCQLYLVVKDGEIIRAEGADGRTNEGTLCLKGRYGWDFLNDPKLVSGRIRKPMIKKNGKFEEVSWDEAIKYTAERLTEIKKKYGPDSIMIAGSARGPGNESNYVLQKFGRCAIGTNNIDHCARVCHGPSVAGLEATLGGGAMTNSIPEIEDAKLIMVFGYNPAEAHPVVARRIVRAKEKGAKLITADPRMTESVRISDLWLQLKNGTNMALVNGFGHVLVNEGLYNKEFIEKYTEGFETYKKQVEKYTPEYVESITGVKAEDIRTAMREYAATDEAMILYGMGVCQFSQAVDVVKGLAALPLLTGKLGRPNVGIGPVRGQNNVQGTCDMGVLPADLPGYQKITNEEAVQKFEKAWGVTLPRKIGTRITEVPHAVLDDNKLKAYYIMGEDPVQSDPHASEIRETMEKLEFVVVQDIFMNKTAMYADVILPATSWGEHEGIYSCADRGFQRIRKAVEPKGDVKVDYEIICELSTAMGYPMSYNNTEEIWNELISLSPLFAGATYEKIERLGSVQWPCPNEESKGSPYLYEGNLFTTPNKKGVLFATEWREPGDKINEEYPLVLSTVREVGHYSVRTMTGNCRALTTLEDEPGYIQMSPEDAKELGIKDGELVKISSRRGSIVSRALVTGRVKKGATYMTYQWWVGACNELTSGHLDPISKTPEFKYCAIKVERIEDQVAAEKKVKEEYDELKKQFGAIK